MTHKQLAVRIFLTGLFLGGLALLTACAAPITVASDSSICTAPTLAECERLSKIGESLHTPAMNAAITGARK